MKERVELYCCRLDGLCYEEREEVRFHLKIQHGKGTYDPILVRRRKW